MKKLLLAACFGLMGVCCFFESRAEGIERTSSVLLTDTVVFDIAQATYSNAAGVYYIDIPVQINSAASGINALDYWFQFDLSKMTYLSTTALVAGLDPFTFYNTNNQVLSNTTSGTSINFSAPLYTPLLKMRFILASPCTEIYSSDFSGANALVNGIVSSYNFTEPAHIPEYQILQPEPYCSASDIVFSYPYTSVNGRVITSYSWDFGNGQFSSLQTDTAVYDPSGDYSVNLTITTVDGCTFLVLNNLTIAPTPVAAFSSTYDALSNVVSFINESTISSGSINLYNWNFGTSSSNLQAPNYTFPAPGFYDVTLTATSDLGCTNTITQLVSATDNVTELANERWFELFPNPASNELHINALAHLDAKIVDLTGRVVRSNFQLQSGSMQVINISDLASGSYYFIAFSETGMQRAKFIVLN